MKVGAVLTAGGENLKALTKFMHSCYHLLMSKIKLIALDLDGTLLCDDGSVSERNVAAVKTAVSKGIQVIIATGKTRGSAVGVLAKLGLKTMGVFTQGLVICRADGSVWYEEALDRETAVHLIQFAEANNLPQCAYSGTHILAPQDGPYQRLLHEKYHEPPLKIVGPLLPQIDAIRINKFLLSEEANNEATRQQLTELVGERATVTQAVPEYIEVLPPGASKGRGVKMVLDALGILPEEMLALGDGENDLEMLQMAGVGAAMANARDLVKAHADFVTADNNHDGVALAIEKFVL